MIKKFTYSFFIAIFFVCVNVSANETIITNLPLWREVSCWKESIENRDAKQAIAEIDNAISAEIAPWRIAVFQGKDWSYSWGFYAYYYKALALYKSDNYVDAYDALMRAYSSMPKNIPQGKFADDYWDWYLLAGKLCSRFGRNLDADWYLSQVRGALPSNDFHYIEATAKLASVRRYQGRLLDSRNLYKNLFLLQPKQKSKVWHNYIRLLFDFGNFEQGVKAIINGVKSNGLSPKYVENDCFIKNACTHWHSFSEYDVLDWYNLLGEQLETTKLERGSENLIALLINTRKLIARIYPDIIDKKPKDLAYIKKRIDFEKTNSILNVAIRADKVLKNKKNKKLIVMPTVSFSDLSAANIFIENAVNNALLKTQKIWKRGGGSPRVWEQILENFSTNDLQKVVIDGESALFHTYSTIGAIYAYKYKTEIAQGFFDKALALPNMGGNADRLTDLLIRYAGLFLRSKNRDLKEAEYYYNWANEINEKNMRLRIMIQSGFPGIILLEKGPQERIDLLQDIINTGGCLPRRAVYERLARDYYRTGNFRMGFKTYVEGIKRTRFKMETGYWDHMIDGLFMNRSFHTSDELKQLRKILKTGALRYPTTVKNAATIARLLSLANEPWINEHIKLANIEESYNCSDKNWLYISNTVFQTPSIRAGVLYIKAQVERDNIGTNYFDWSGWIKGWQIIDKETRSGKPSAPTDSGVFTIANEAFIKQLENYTNRINNIDVEMIGNVVCQRGPKLRNVSFDKVTKLFSNLKQTNIVFKLHYYRMSRRRKSSPDNPSYKAMVELCKQGNKDKSTSLLNLLKRNLNLEKDEDKKFKWESLVNEVK